MVMSFLKEICFTIFSVPFMKVDLSKRSNYVGLVWIVLALYALCCLGTVYVACLCVCAVLLAGYDVWSNRGLKPLQQKLLDP
jgi:hypothetical protein